jgi:D-alanyl-D-alanine carboxypeptidase
MVRKLLVVTLLCLGLFVASASAKASAAQPRTFDPTAKAAVDQIATAGLGGGITGITVGISDPKLGYYVKSFGTTDGKPVTPNMHYRIASVSKTFTADAVLHLVQQGKLSLNAHISQFVSGIPYGNRITIRDLLAMRGGVYDFVDNTPFFDRYENNPLLPGWNPSDVLKLVRANKQQAAAPNQKTVYSNSEYVLLGYVIQKVSGESAPRYISSLIRQLGLRQTSFPTTPHLPKPFIHGYVGPMSGTDLPADKDVTFSNPLVPWTAGAIVSTVPDMLKYDGELGTGAGLSPRLWKLRRSWAPLTTTGPKLQYGLGLTQLGKWIGHDGSIFGYSDLVFYLPAKHVSVVVMANAAAGGYVPAQAVWGEIVNKLYPGTITYWPSK